VRLNSMPSVYLPGFKFYFETKCCSGWQAKDSAQPDAAAHPLAHDDVTAAGKEPSSVVSCCAPLSLCGGPQSRPATIPRGHPGRRRPDYRPSRHMRVGSPCQFDTSPRVNRRLPDDEGRCRPQCESRIGDSRMMRGFRGIGGLNRMDNEGTLRTETGSYFKWHNIRFVLPKIAGSPPSRGGACHG
jgi:hypothetical protein